MTTRAAAWMTGTYDPDLDLVYWGTGNPTPVLNGKPRPGTASTPAASLAIPLPRHGQAGMGFPACAHDTHDWDAAETPVLVDANFQGKPRKMLMQTSRSGYFSCSTAPTVKTCCLFPLDQQTGRSESTKMDNPSQIQKKNLLPTDA